MWPDWPAMISATTEPSGAPELGATIKPAYWIKETPDAYGVTVFLPGVAKDGLEITAEDGQLRIIGRRAWQQPAGWTALYRESADAAMGTALAERTRGTLELRDPKPDPDPEP